MYHSSWYSCREKAGNMLGDHLSIFLERKVTSIQQMDLAVWQILLERLCPVGSKDGIILAPHGQERRLMLPEVLLPLCIALQIGAIVFEEGQTERIGELLDTWTIAIAVTRIIWCHYMDLFAECRKQV